MAGQAMSIILAVTFLIMLASIVITCVALLIKKAMDLLIGKKTEPLPVSIEEARPGTMLLRSIDGGAEYTEVLTYDGATDTYFIEQRAANYMQDKKYTAIEFKDAEGKTHRVDRSQLHQRGWGIN
jgi:hypothetical protein